MLVRFHNESKIMIRCGCVLLTAELEVAIAYTRERGCGGGREVILGFSIFSHLSLKVKGDMFTIAFEKAKTVSSGQSKSPKGKGIECSLGSLSEGEAGSYYSNIS